MLKLKKLDEKIVEFQEINDHLLKGTTNYDKIVERSTQYSASIRRNEYSVDKIEHINSGRKLATM